jgi:hypothetical protein
VKPLIVIACLLAIPALAHSQTLYKCAEGGKTIYQPTPCSGSGSVVKNWDTQTREQQLEAENRALREELGRRRQAQEFSQPPRQAFGRTQGDLRAERANSQDCREATRSYDNEAFSQSSTHSTLASKRRAVDVACGTGF